MTREEMAKLMEESFRRLEGLRNAGQKEYAHDEDNAFANFERVADRLSVQCSCGNEVPLTREVVLMVYALKHVDGIIAAVNGHESQREPVVGRLDDARVYLTLLEGMICG